MEQEIKKWTCPTCGKEISSLYEKQLEQNKKSHLSTHGEEDE